MSRKPNFSVGISVLICLLFVLVTSLPVAGDGSKVLALTEVGHFALDDAYEVVVDESKGVAYVTCGYSGVVILDVTDPTSPVELVRVPSAYITTERRNAYAHQFSIRDDLMYVGDGTGGLKIINCSDPSNPEVVIQFVDGYPWSARLVDNYALLPHGYFGVNGKLVVVDITNLSDPRVVKRCSTDGAASDIEIQGNLAFMTTSFGGFTVFNLTNRTDPVIVANWKGQSNNNLESGNLEVFNDLIYLSYWEQSFKILNVSDLASIAVTCEIDEYDALFSVRVKIDRGLAFLSDHALGLVVLDVSDPSQPVEITRYFDCKPCIIQVAGDLVYMTDQDNGLIILEMGEKSVSAISGFYFSPELAVVASISLVVEHRIQRKH